ncbi:MAG: hypothetical protein PHP64_02100 [Actinomycetota bacterium]|nr:hypothetical protein [Actinomycetota bacterium]
MRQQGSRPNAYCMYVEVAQQSRSGKGGARAPKYLWNGTLCKARKPATSALCVAVFAALLLSITLLIPQATAQDLSFEVPYESVILNINTDSSIDFWYRIEFENDSEGAPIDVVDIGMPTSDYQVSECSAAIDGNALYDIKPSSVVSPGVEVHLNERAIMPGTKGVFEFHGKNYQMVYADTEHKGYASFEFKNTWWSKSFAHGETFLSVTIQFPPGVKPNETVYHREKFTTSNTSEGIISFTWVKSKAKPTEGYLFGVSFPAIYVSGVYPRQPLPDYKPVSGSSYDSYTGADWLRIFPMLAAALLALIRTILSFVRVKKRGAKIDYIKPKLGVEGTGACKSLLPAEVAILLSQDLDRVTAVAIFDMISKGLITLTSLKPLRLKRAGKPLIDKEYYPLFLGAITPEGLIEPESLRLALKGLVSEVEKKVRGFSEAETISHYKNESSEAWLRVGQAQKPQERIEKFQQYTPLLLLDPGFGAKLKDFFSRGIYPVPSWGSSILEKEGSLQASAGGAHVEGGKFATAIANAFRSIQDEAQKHTSEFERKLVKEVNLEEYRRVYRPILRSRYYGYHGGGAGCACACACAGCACACAGGGR